jgi:biopolymer transport protein ExbD
MKLASKNKISTEFSMASMTDIVFLLLIFFMLTTSVANESVLEIVLPKSEGKQADNQPVVMEVSSLGTFALDGIVIPKEAIEQELSSKMKLMKNPSFIIKADENSAHKHVVFLMSLAHKNRYKVVIATSPIE